MIPTLNVANKFVTGAEFIPEQINTKESGIAFHLQNPSVGLNPIAKMFMPILLPKNINPGKKSNYTFWDTLPGFGHRNSLGITDKGKFAINYMFKDFQPVSERAISGRGLGHPRRMLVRQDQRRALRAKARWTATADKPRSGRPCL